VRTVATALLTECCTARPETMPALVQMVVKIMGCNTTVGCRVSPLLLSVIESLMFLEEKVFYFVFKINFYFYHF
jgi:hypothetical protein